MKDLILIKADSLKERLIKHRRFLHANAETGFDTDITSKYIHDTLCSFGVECFYLSKNAVIGNIKGKNEGKTILLRADIDALPIQEKVVSDFACKKGNMHACGHDMHASMLLGAAEILEGLKDTFCGNVRLLFQPAEEILSGAKEAADNGALEKVDYAMTVHVLTATEFETGTAVLSYDTPCAPSADFFSMVITGKGCHGSSPSLGIDPISCACRVVTALEHIKTHEIGIHEKAVLTIGEIHAGNSANAIPDEAVLRGTLRCFDEETRTYYKKRLEEISTGIAQSFMCSCKIEYTSSCPSLINNPELLSKTSQNLEILLGKDKVVKIKDTRSKIQGSEDFAYISHIIPSVSVAIPAGRKDNGHIYPLHNPKVTFDENALSVGCSIFAYNAINLLL